MLVYKLTNPDMTTYGGCKWELGVSKETTGLGNLCSSGWLHYYDDANLAIIMNPIHAHIKHPRLFKARAKGEHKSDMGLKYGCTNLTLIKELEVPEISDLHKIAFAILCIRRVCKEPSRMAWSKDYLSGKDRTTKYISNVVKDNWRLFDAIQNIMHAIDPKCPTITRPLLDIPDYIALAITYAAGAYRLKTLSTLKLKPLIKQAMKIK